MKDFALAPSQRPIGFLDLPYEIRLQIYGHCFPRRFLFDVSFNLFSRFDPLENAYVHGSLSDDAGYQDMGDESPSHVSEDDQPEHFESLCNSPGVKGCSDLEEETQSHPSDDDPIELFGFRYDGTGGLRRSVLPSLLQVSQQVSDETLNMLYGDNAFKVIMHGEGERRLKKIFSEANRRRIQQIMLVLRPMGVSYEPKFRVDTAMWDSILPHLKTLWIVAEQPLKDDHYYNGQTLVEKMKKWIAWLTPILEYLAKTLPTESTVRVDVNEREETSKLIQKHLQHRCQQARTKTGDFVFKRGEFSIESGYWDDDDGPYNCRDIYDYGSDSCGYGIRSHSTLLDAKCLGQTHAPGQA